MPAQKRCLSENLDDEEQHQHHAKQSRPHPQSLVDDEVIVDDDEEAGQHLELQPQEQQVKEEDDEDEGGGGGEEEEDGDDDEAEDKQTVKQQQQHEKEKEENEEEEEEDAEAEDSQGSPSSTLQEKPEFVFVQLTDIRKDVQCPICLDPTSGATLQRTNSGHNVLQVPYRMAGDHMLPATWFIQLVWNGTIHPANHAFTGQGRDDLHSKALAEKSQVECRSVFMCISNSNQN